MSHFCSTNDCFVTFQHFLPYAISRHDNILHIAIARCLNDEKVGAVKIAGQENVSRVYPFFFFLPHPKRRYASSANSKRELQPGHDSRNYILRDNSIMFHGWCTHALARVDMRRVSFYYTETSFRQRRYWLSRTTSCFRKNLNSSPILSIHHLQKGRKITSEENHG